MDSETGTVFENVEIPAAPLEDAVMSHIILAINRPKDFFELSQRQAVNSLELENLLSKKRAWMREIKEYDDCVIALEDQYLRGKISEERRNALYEKYQ